MDDDHDSDLVPTPAPPSAIPSFTPVPRKVARADGWTPLRQKRFIAALAAMGSVTRAAEAVGMSYTGAYALRVADGAESFSRAWDAALERGADRVYDVLIDQAVHGVPEPIMYAGKQVAEKRRFNHRTMMWVVEHHRGGGSGARKINDRKRTRAEEIEALDELEELRARVKAKLERLHQKIMREIVVDPEKRSAHEVVYGPTDWSKYGLVEE